MEETESDLLDGALCPISRALCDECEASDPLQKWRVRKMKKKGGAKQKENKKGGKK